jgi:tetratricopeptide (TPR) repeat protein
LQAAGEATNIRPKVARFLTLTLKGVSRVKIASPKLNTSHLTRNEEAMLRCQTALDLKDRGVFESAQEVLRPFWNELGSHPNIKGLHPSVAAEVCICVGILTGWIGSKKEAKDSQEVAKNLITEGITYFESVGDTKKIAAARAEIAYCYWRQGSLDEARIMLNDALQVLTAEGNTRAKALLKLVTVEWSASRHHVALRLLTENARLFDRVSNYTTRGNYHNESAIILRHLAKSERTDENLQSALGEFEKADHFFKLARNNVYRASVKNNVGLILLNQGRYKDAQKYLTEARRLSTIVRDKTQTAQIDESRAQVLLAEQKFKEAETVARGAVSVLEKSGHQSLLADSLITHGVALARLKKTAQAQFTFQRAIEIAYQVGALNKAGLAALTLVEELDELPTEISHAAYNRASEWLVNSQSQEILLRLNTAARKVLLNLRGDVEAEESTNNLLNKPCDLQAEVLRYEGALIRQALGKVNGSVTRAAALLGMSYQGLAYVIQSRHKDLLKERSPIRRRSRRDTVFHPARSKH